jgi:hypothetical protein
MISVRLAAAQRARIAIGISETIVVVMTTTPSGFASPSESQQPRSNAGWPRYKIFDAAVLVPVRCLPRRAK